MKVLLDQWLPLSTAGLLRADGFDALHSGEMGLAGPEDETRLERARRKR